MRFAVTTMPEDNIVRNMFFLYVFAWMSNSFDKQMFWKKVKKIYVKINKQFIVIMIIG